MIERVSRPSARVLVVDESGGVLLFRILDPLDDKPPVWITPGGAVEAGETLAEAAARELGEETGVLVDPERLGDPVAVCRGDWEFRGAALSSVDWFFALRLPRFDPSDDGLEDLEREIHDTWRWWLPDDLEGNFETVLPSGLADLVRDVFHGRSAAEAIELPWLTV